VAWILDTRELLGKKKTQKKSVMLVNYQLGGRGDEGQPELLFVLV
jgi:hypothetical protein